MGCDRERLEGGRERKINIEPRQDMPTWQVFPRRKRDTRVRRAGKTAGAGSNAFG